MIINKRKDNITSYAEEFCKKQNKRQKLLKLSVRGRLTDLIYAPGKTIKVSASMLSFYDLVITKEGKLIYYISETEDEKSTIQDLEKISRILKKDIELRNAKEITLGGM